MHAAQHATHAPHCAFSAVVLDVLHDPLRDHPFSWTNAKIKLQVAEPGPGGWLFTKQTNNSQNPLRTVPNIDMDPYKVRYLRVRTRRGTFRGRSRVSTRRFGFGLFHVSLTRLFVSTTVHGELVVQQRPVDR